MFEYAISDGEGTLITYGVVSADELRATIEPAVDDEMLVMFRVCDDDCETGK